MIKILEFIALAMLAVLGFLLAILLILFLICLILEMIDDMLGIDLIREVKTRLGLNNDCWTIRHF